MCIAILKTKDGVITDQQLRNCFQNNNDGAGIAYTVNKHIIVRKGIFNEDEFIAEYQHQVMSIMITAIRSWFIAI